MKKIKCSLYEKINFTYNMAYELNLIYNIIEYLTIIMKEEDNE